MNPLLSVIVPVYNVEEYLNQCIESILRQDLKKYEIILVDDGSTDNSGKICDEFAAKYNHIKCCHQQNMGLAEARNTGINTALGEYLMFVDSDDFINGKENLNDITAELKSDIIQYKMVYYYNDSKQYLYFSDYQNYEGLSYKQTLKRLVATGQFHASACIKLVKRGLIIDNQLYFRRGLLSEYIDWSLRLVLHAKSLTLINKNFYIYRQQRKGSITQGGSAKSVKDLFSIIKYWHDYSYKDKDMQMIIFNYLAYQYQILLTISNKNNSSKVMMNDILRYKSLLLYSKNRKVKLANLVLKTFGIGIGKRILEVYLYLHKKGFALLK